VIGAAGLSARRGVTELDDRDADVIRGGLERTERIIVIADGSKFGAVAMSTVVPIDKVATVVTDSSADAEEIERIKQAGVEVVVAGSDPSLLRPMENGKTRLTDVRRPA
jgi:DeoR family transcriptional regulator of aga operon